MELYKKVVWITQGGGEFAGVLAKKLICEEATVILSGNDEEGIRHNAKATGAFPFVTNIMTKAKCVQYIDYLLALFKRIDACIFNLPFIKTGDPFKTDAEDNHYWHQVMLQQLRVINHLLPGMIKRKCGHFVLTVPLAGMLSEFALPDYNLTKHVSLHIAERLQVRYKSVGIHVSVLNPGLWDGEKPFMSPHNEDVLACTDIIVQSILENRFFIPGNRAFSKKSWVALMPVNEKNFINPLSQVINE